MPDRRLATVRSLLRALPLALLLVSCGKGDLLGLDEFEVAGMNIVPEGQLIGIWVLGDGETTCAGGIVRWSGSDVTVEFVRAGDGASGLVTVPIQDKRGIPSVLVDDRHVPAGTEVSLRIGDGTRTELLMSYVKPPAVTSAPAALPDAAPTLPDMWANDLTLESICGSTEECQDYRVHVARSGWLEVSVPRWSEAEGKSWEVVEQRQLPAHEVTLLERAVALVSLPDKPAHYAASVSDSQTLSFTIRTGDAQHELLLDGPFGLLDQVPPDSASRTSGGIARYIELWAVLLRSVPETVSPRRESDLLASLASRGER